MDSMKRIASVVAAGTVVLLCSQTFALAQTTGADEVVETGDGARQDGDLRGDGAKGTGKGKGNEAEQTADETVDEAEQTAGETVDEAEQTAGETVDEAEQTIDETVGGATDPATDAIGDAQGVAVDAGAGTEQAAPGSPLGDRGSATSTDRLSQRSASGKMERAGRDRATVRGAGAEEQRREAVARLRDIVSSGNLVAGPAPVQEMAVESETKEDSGGLSLSLPLTGSQLMGLVGITLVLICGGGLLWFAARRASRKRAFLLRRADARQ
jgi:hypothetical protein